MGFFMTVTSYNGNPNLKSPYTEIEYTPHQLQEYAKCAADPIYFINNYVKIITLDHGLVQIKLRDYQIEFIRKMQNNRRVACMQSRQSAKSTTVACFMLWCILFQEHYSIAILANKASQSIEILSRLQLAYEHIPKWLQQGVISWNKGSIELENGSTIITSATSGSAIRGRSISLLYLDEFSHVPRNIQEDFFTSVYPVISSGKDSKIILTTTPKGYDLFQKIWSDSEQGKNDYVLHFVHWSQVPGRDEKWKEETIRNTSLIQFMGEFECEFLGSSYTLISGACLGRLSSVDPLERSEQVYVYDRPKPNGNYVIVADVARGVGNDFSAFVVFDITEYPYKVVAKYKDNTVSHLIFPQYIYQFAKSYNDAFVLVEINDIGQVVSDILFNDFEYENMLLVQAKGQKGQQIGGGYGGTQPVFGVRTTTPVKRIGCANLKSMMEGQKLIVTDEDIIDELKHFVQSKNSYAAEEGSHDDLVMCCVLFAWLVNQEYFKEIADADIRAILSKDNEKLISDSMLPFGFISNGSEFDEDELEMPATISFNNHDSMFGEW
ncbi:terminase large subunit [Caulobacter phage Cr30]|uniref:terminase large subunit n=1 Tax=Caulobacter phage Cr30 TaxID=1357714 RepID=UPI0004A9B3A9|nr:terminase large subunit [Caulobacter phage Cr30]AGS81078.1 terminase large subunit [Caulobacter phage Cr30]